MSARNLKILFIILSVLLTTHCARAQQFDPVATQPADTLDLFTAVIDSLAETEEDDADSIETEDSGVDTTIAYAAKSIEFFVKKKQTVLLGDASVNYQGMMLKAEKITVAWDDNLIIAEAVHDTLWLDSLQTEIDTIKITGRPIFVEGDQQIVGDKMTYNLNTRRGKVIEGRTSYNDGYYWGANIKKEPTEVMHIGPGSFTTCSEEHPHYCFKSVQMKMIKGDKVVARPVILYFGEVPVAAVPYGLFPSRKGRHSGLIIPTYGESSRNGRFLKHLGYYWAANDYSDLEGAVDYYEESGFLFHGLGRYNWRYHLSGSLMGSYQHQTLDGVKQRRWELRWGHNQDIDPNTKLRVDANIISDGSYYQDYSFNLNQQLAQTLRSDATLTHSFPGTKNSMTVNLHHEQNLRNEEITQIIPRVNFRRGQTAIIPLPEKDPDDTTNVEPRWYHNLYYSYNGEYIHKRVIDEIKTSADTSLVQNRRSAAKHSLSFNSPQKIFSYFSISPGISYREDWFDESLDYSDDPNGVKKEGFAARRTFSTSLGLSTKLYGYWVNPLPGVEAIRHTMSPNVSLSYRPDFSDPLWGYFDAVTDTSGITTREDRFAGSLYGSTQSGKQMALNFSLNNLFQMKYGSGEEMGKRDLFTLNFSSSYNFALDSLRFAPLRSSFRASPISKSQAVGPLQSLSLDLTTSHSFYKYSQGTSKEYDEYYLAPEDGKLLRLTSFDVSASSKFSLGKLMHSPDKVKQETRQQEGEFGIASEDTAPDTTSEVILSQPASRAWYMGEVPWDLTLALHYTTNRYNPYNPTETFWLRATVDASITRNWQISYNTKIDLVEHEVITAGLTIYRDMHCWEARFTWNPLGFTQGYFLKINIKSPQLQDVKVERTRGQGSFMGF